MTLLKFIGKIALICIITIIGAGITCWGNLFISSIHVPLLWDFENLVFLWIAEILSIFLLSINYLFLRGRKEAYRVMNHVIAVVLIWWTSSLFMDYSISMVLIAFILINFIYFTNLWRIGLQFLQKKYSKWRVWGAENTDLMNTLSQVDISKVSSVTFLPSNWVWFTIKTPNIKRLAVYITEKMAKTIFEHDELRKAFDYVVMNISSNLSKTDFTLVAGKINDFVKSGGEVKINKE